MKVLKRAKVIFSITGDDALQFLQRMLSANISQLTASDPSACQSLFLSARGELVAQVSLLHFKKEILCAVDAPYAEEFRNSLETFILSEDVKLRPLERELACYWAFEEDAVVKRGKLDFFVGEAQALEGGFELQLSWQGIPLKELWLDEASAATQIGDSEALDFDQWRCSKGLALFGEEILSGDSAINFPLGESVCFKKGCFRGQEVVAKGTVRGKPPFIFGKLSGFAGNGQELLQEGKKVGRVLSKSGTDCLVSLRRSVLSQLDEAMLIELDNEDSQLRFEPAFCW